jgi:hypothetical protein
MTRSRALEPSPIGLIGGVLAIISCFLAWDAYNDTFDVPLKFLWDKDATGGVELGIPLVSVAGVVALFSVSAIEPLCSCGDSEVWCYSRLPRWGHLPGVQTPLSGPTRRCPGGRRRSGRLLASLLGAPERKSSSHTGCSFFDARATPLSTLE